MPFRQVPNAPYTPKTPNDSTGWNAGIQVIINEHNQHNHDPGSPLGNTAESIPSWGPANPLYALHGEGSSGSDWDSAYNGTAAIPADPTGYTADPNSTITAAHGVHYEIAQLRGMLARLTGGAWNAHVSMAQTDAGGNITLSGTQTISANQIISTTTTSPPLAVSSTSLVTNLNADMVDGHSAIATHVGDGSGNTNTGFLPALNENGFLSPGYIEADFTEDDTFFSLTIGLDNSTANLRRIRGMLTAWAHAAGLNNWKSAPATLVTGVTAQGSVPLSGTVNLVGGTGTLVSLDNNTIRIDVTGTVAPTSGALNYGDVFPDGVVSGLTVTQPAQFLNTETVQVNAGQAYVSGTRAQLGVATQLTISGTGTYYVDWMGGSGSGSFSINQNATAAGNYIRLASVVSDGTKVTGITDLRTIITRYTAFNPPIPPVPAANGMVLASQNGLAAWAAVNTGGSGGASYVLPAATTAILGGVLIDRAPASGNPIAVTVPSVGAASGVASLDASAHVPLAQLSGITNTQIATSAAIAKSKLAPLALVDADVSGISLAKITQSSANNGQVPVWNGVAWVPSTPTTGTVTSVAIAVPADMTVSGSPITAGGTITLGRTSQNANLVMAGPASGVAAAPGYRALVNADIPTGITASKISGALSGATLATSALTGTVADTQIAGMSSSKLIGTVADTQIAGMSSSKLIGTVADTQIAALSASKLTGTVPLAALSGITSTQIAAGAAIAKSQLAPLAIVDADVSTISLTKIAQTGATTGQVPQWNGSAWVPATPASGGGTTTTLYRRGINDAGGDFGIGAYDGPWHFDNQASLNYLKGRGMDIIRLPLLWENIQPTLSSALDPTNLTHLTDMLTRIKTAGLSAIIDIHNYAAYKGAITAPAAPTLATATTGGTVAAGTYKAIISYVNSTGESVGSASATVVTTGATSTITVTSPTNPAPAGYLTGYYVYLTAAGGSTYTRQQAAGSPTALGTNFVLTAPPTSTGANPSTIPSIKSTLNDGVLTQAHFTDLWTRLSTALKGGNYGIYAYGLMNEPANIPSSTGAYTPSTTLYNFPGNSVMGWAAENAPDTVGASATAPPSNLVAGATGSILFSSNSGSTSTPKYSRLNDSNNNTAVQSNGSTISAWVLVPTGTAGSWTARIELQDSGFAWHAGSDAPLTPGTWAQLTYTPATSTWTGHKGIAIQFTSTNGSGGVVSLYVAEVQQGTSGATTTGAQIWQQCSQACVTAIRNNTDTTLIMVPGYNYSAAQNWSTNHPTPWITDTANNFKYEAHYYPDTDHSGTFANSFATETTNATGAGYASVSARATSDLAVFTNWLTTNSVKGFIGETGWPGNGADATSWNSVGSAMYAALDTAQLDVTYWATGEYWGAGYSYPLAAYAASAGTLNTANSQSAVLEAHLTATGSGGGGSYTLPIASASVLGGIKVGAGLSIDGTGVLSSSGGYTLPIASASVLGGIKVGSGLSIDGTGVLSAPGGGFAGTTITFNDGGNIVVGTGTGTKIATGATQKLGFFGATPIVQPASLAGTGSMAGSVYTTVEQRMLQDVFNALEALGLLK